MQYCLNVLRLTIFDRPTINFERMQIHQKAAWDDLLKDGFGGSLSGQPFSTIHGDFITETINREVEVRGGPM